jgi:hypothetical protein
MNATPNIEYDKFTALGGLDLCHYMEPLLNDCTASVSGDMLDHMLSELPTYDEYHLVYALELGARHSPKTFAMQLPLYLAHEQGVVWSAALRNLEQLPSEYVTDTLVDLVRSAHNSYPQKPWIIDALRTLEIRLREKRLRSLSAINETPEHKEH